jgi:hypothetical protein
MMLAINNPRFEFVYTWSEELAEKLSHMPEEFRRTPIELRTRGLSALSFPHQTLEIHFQDGSLSRFRNAFFVTSKDSKYLAVFTEHCGYFSWTAKVVKAIFDTEEKQVFPLETE